jgi:sulfhydrogenase subunit alpha
MVGSLARLALWGDRLRGRAAKVFDALFPDPVTDNVLFNTRAQVVELVYCLESAVHFCDAYLEIEESEFELQPVEERSGRGIGAIEAPRGTLIHEYELDDNGKVTAANVVTPTAQNLANIERDLRSSGDRLQQEEAVTDAELKKALEMVARAYDPCISCSVHLVRING